MCLAARPTLADNVRLYKDIQILGIGAELHFRSSVSRELESEPQFRTGIMRLITLFCITARLIPDPFSRHIVRIRGLAAEKSKIEARSCDIFC